MSVSNDRNISHVTWCSTKKDFKDNDLSLTFYQYCLEESINNGAKIFSLGTTSKASIGKFKEQLRAKKAILIKRNISFKKGINSKNHMKSIRNVINIKLMKFILKMTKLILGTKGFEKIGKEIWRRFD